MSVQTRILLGLLVLILIPGSLRAETATTGEARKIQVLIGRLGGVIKNVTAPHVRHVDLEFGIGYDDDIHLAGQLLSEIVEAHEKGLKKPQPNIRLHTPGDSSVNFIVRPWVKTDGYRDVYWEITREVKVRFDREGTSIPCPQRDVHLNTDNDGRTT